MTLIQSEEEARSFVAARCATEDFQRIERFVTLLERANQSQNLIAHSSFVSVWQRHIADSAQLLDHVPRETAPWLDLGTGAGPPGLMLAIMMPGRPFVLVESRNLRIRWLREVVAELAVTNCTVEGAYLRVVATFDAAVISARAFAPLHRLVAQSARFSTTQTHWVLPKGQSAAKEVQALPEILQPMFHVKQSVTDREAGIVLGVGKVEVAA